MDFYNMHVTEKKDGGLILSPNFVVGKSKDLMVRGRAFYAIWDEERGMWSTDEYDVQRLVDNALRDHADKLEAQGTSCKVKYLQSYGNNGWNQFRRFMNNISDNSHQLDDVVILANTAVRKADYASRRLPY